MNFKGASSGPIEVNMKYYWGRQFCRSQKEERSVGDAERKIDGRQRTEMSEKGRVPGLCECVV